MNTALAIGSAVQIIGGLVGEDQILFAYRSSDNLLMAHWTNGPTSDEVTKAVIEYSHDVKIGIKRHHGLQFLQAIESVFGFVEPGSPYTSVGIKEEKRGYVFYDFAGHAELGRCSQAMTTFAGVTNADHFMACTPFERAALVVDFLSKIEVPDAEELDARRTMALDPAYVEHRQDDGREYEPVADD